MSSVKFDQVDLVVLLCRHTGGFCFCLFFWLFYVCFFVVFVVVCFVWGFLLLFFFP